MAEVKVLSDLEIGEKYSGRAIDHFIVRNEDVVVISESCMNCADLQTEALFEVKAKFKGYNHTRFDEKYHIPVKLSRVYIIS